MRLQFIFVFFLCFFSAQSKVRLPALVADHMVLQQNAKIKVWGWARPGEQIFIKGSWSSASARAVADRDGNWSTFIRTLNAGGPYSMTIVGENRINIKNILFGEVWFCSGQSNMEFTLKQLGGWKSPLFSSELKVFDDPYLTNIRLFNIERNQNNKPEEDCRGSWKIARKNTVENFSATAWFFGVNLFESLRVPIGLISASWGGTGAEVWIPESFEPRYDQDGWFETAPNKSKWWPGKPGVLYNGMIHPALNYKIKGVIWYQGETNREQADRYVSMMKTLVFSWRKAWRNRMPFYYVQIAPYSYKESYAGALLREAQWKASKQISKSGMVVTMDLGEKDDIHPKKKKEVGKRLAAWALSKTYAFKRIRPESPSFRRIKIEPGQIRIFFDHCTQLKATENTLNLFQIAAADKRFYRANARIEGNTVVVRSVEVKKPVAVRFAFTNYAHASLLNEYSLPASSFRSDDWLIEE